MSVTADPDVLPDYVPTCPAEQEFLAGYDPSRYPRVEATVDVVLLTIRDGALSVLLVRRADFPYRDRWALPGGFVNPGEDLEVAAARELVEETNLASPRGHLEQLGTYGTPGRDPRTRVLSVAYLALLPHLETPVGGDDAAEARFWPVEDLVEQGLPLAFDHARILADGLDRAAAKLEYTALATAFCAEEFTIGELRRVYETVWGSRESGPNFRRKVLATPGFIEPAEGSRVGAGGGAPGQLYRRGTATLLHPPMLRPQLRDPANRTAGGPGPDGQQVPARLYTHDLSTGRLVGGATHDGPAAPGAEEQ